MWGAAMQAVEQWLPDENFVPPNPSALEGDAGHRAEHRRHVACPRAAATLEDAGFTPRSARQRDSGSPDGHRRLHHPGLGELDAKGAIVTIYPSTGFVPKPPNNGGGNGGGNGNGNGNGDGNGDGNGGGGGGGGNGDSATATTAGPRRRPGLTRSGPPSWRRTSAATAPPSARPLTWGWTTPITLPMARMPSPAAPACAIAVGDDRSISSVGELLGQVVGDHRGLGALLRGHLGAAAVVERGRRLAPLLGLAWRAPRRCRRR